MHHLFVTLRKIFTLPALRQRLAMTVFLAGIFRLGTFILLPGIDPTQKAQEMTGMLAWLDNFISFGSSFSSRSIFALGISPYISASIVLQVATLIVPYFQRLKKEGPAGQAKINYSVRLLTLLMVPLQAIPYLRSTTLQQGNTLLPTFAFVPLSIVLLTAGTFACIWLADRIKDKGIGNGTSVLIMVRIISGLPLALTSEARSTGTERMLFFALEMAILLVLIITIITFTEGVRKVPLQYARQTTISYAGYGTARSTLPLKMNAPGVMPIIFAQMLSSGPLAVANFFKDRSPFAARVVRVLNNHYGWEATLIIAVLIFFATFFYTAVFTSPQEMADNLKRSGAFIPGVKPGKPTAEYIDEVISRNTLPAALFFACIATTPALAHAAGVGKAFCRFYGGTTLLLLISTILEIINQIKGHLTMRQYDEMARSSGLATDEY